MAFYEKLKDPYFRNFFKRVADRKAVHAEALRRKEQGILDPPPEKTDYDRAIAQISLDIRGPFFPPDRLIKVNQDISDDSEKFIFPSQMLEHYIKTAKHRFIMEVCGCREGGQCEHFPREVGCLFIGEASEQFNKELGHSATVEEALAHVKNWRDHGLAVHLGYVPMDAYAFKVSPPQKLMSICGCCPCCCITPLFSYSKMPGLDIRVISEKCTGCGECISVPCAFKALEVADGKAIIDSNRCKSCGRCVEMCPSQAIEVMITDPDYVQKTMNWVGERVDVT